LNTTRVTARALAKTAVVVASIVLFIGAVIHIGVGYPLVARAVASAHITKAPGMSPAELQAVWLVAAFLMVALSVVPLLALGVADLFRRLALLCGAATLLCGALVAAFAGATHPAVIIFTLSGALFVYGGVMA